MGIVSIIHPARADTAFSGRLFVLLSLISKLLQPPRPQDGLRLQFPTLTHYEKALISFHCKFNFEQPEAAFWHPRLLLHVNSSR